MKKPLVSVVIPTYNREDLLFARAIPSILNQTYQNFEIIVVLDGCTDNTEKRLKELNDSRILIHVIKERYSGKNSSIYLNWCNAGGFA